MEPADNAEGAPRLRWQPAEETGCACHVRRWLAVGPRGHAQALVKSRPAFVPDGFVFDWEASRGAGGPGNKGTAGTLDDAMGAAGDFALALGPGTPAS